MKPIVSTPPLHFPLRLCLQNAQQIVFISQKIVLLFTNNEHGAGRSAHDAFRSAADAEMLPTGVTVRCHHDKIYIELLGRFHDLMRSKSPAKCRCYSDNSPPARPCGQRLQALFRASGFCFRYRRGNA
jgi:hypothetical protein